MSSPARLSEASFQRSIIELAQLSGWLTYHTHDSRRSASGYPDLTLARGDRLIFAELKTDHGRVSAEQQRWLDALAHTAAEVHVWRPGNWEEIVHVLSAATTS